MPNRYLPFEVDRNYIKGRLDKCPIQPENVRDLYLIGAVVPYLSSYVIEEDGRFFTVQEWVSVNALNS